ncbi:MAG: alpha/beta hydrolase [Archangium sp.]|nr:alpha/beta hydrolase [Archangium sp.]
MSPPARALALALFAFAGCSRNLGVLIHTRAEVPDERIVGLFPCEAGGRDVVDLDPSRPVTVLVHGCNSSGERFKTLAQVFEANGQQTICFNYNDRDYINTSATQLATSLSALQRRLEPREITVLGHSQGGLIARRALQADLPRPLVTREGFSYRLVTISAPFSGISSSADCGRTWLHVLSFSATVLVCLVVTGNKWTEIPPGSGFMTNPTPFIGTRHLQIVTDERATCRHRRGDGTCEVDDFVFGLDEQRSAIVSADPRVTTVELREGHAAVVGENGVAPLLLIDALQKQNVLAATPPGQQAAFAGLLARLYPR